MQRLRSVKTVSARRQVFWILFSIFLVSSTFVFPGAKRSVECARYLHDHPYRKDVTLNFQGQPIQAEVVKTEAERERGLGGRECMNKNQAMLFEFQKDDFSNHCFWMKDMKFPLDIYWLNDEKRIVFSATGIDPSTYPKEYCPSIATRYVIEMHAGVGRELLLDYDDIVPF